MRELLFRNPVFRPGLNVSVRNGTKWADLQPGELLTLRETDGPVVGLATAVMTRSVTFTELPEIWLRQEHDPLCTTKAGLAAALDQAYGPGQWGPDLTVVFFHAESQ